MAGQPPEPSSTARGVYHLFLGNVTFQAFPVGTYTVLVQDIWGHQALCYFVVSTGVTTIGG